MERFMREFQPAYLAFIGSALIKQTITQLALNRPQNWVHVNRHGVNVEVDLLGEVATHDALPKNTAAS